MAKNQSKEASPKIRRTKTSKTMAKSPSSTFEEWLRLQVVKPTETKPEAQPPSDSYDQWILERVRKKVEVEG